MIAILFSHLLVMIMLFLSFVAIIVGFRHHKKIEREKRDFTRRHNEEMGTTRFVEHDEFNMYDHKN